LVICAILTLVSLAISLEMAPPELAGGLSQPTEEPAVSAAELSESAAEPSSPVSKSPQGIRLTPLSAIWALGALALFLAYRALWQKPNGLAHIDLWLLSAFFAAIMTLAQSFAAVGTTELLTGSASAKIKACLFLAGRIPLYYMALTFLRDALSREVFFARFMEHAYTEHAHSARILEPAPKIPELHPLAEAGNESDPVARFVRRRKSIAIIALLIFLCWLPYYVLTFPGAVSNDSITQLKEIFDVKPLSAGNPIVQTLLLQFFCAVGLAFGSADMAVALYCAVQALLMTALFAYTVRFMIRMGTPLWLCALALGFFALCPVFPLFAFCVGKDTNFAMVILFFTLMVWQTMRQPKGEPLPLRFAFGLCLSAALLPLLRNPGHYLALLTPAILLLWTLRKELRKEQLSSAARHWLAPLCALAAVGVVWAGLHFAVLPLIGAEPMPEAEEYSVPLQQVARVVASQPESLTREEREAISGVMEFSAAKARYDREFGITESENLGADQ